MVSIHEPVRMLFVIETLLERLFGVLQGNASFRRLAENRWIRLAVIDPDTGRVAVLGDAASKISLSPWNACPWRMRHPSGTCTREHLPMAWIQSPAGAVAR